MQQCERFLEEREHEDIDVMHEVSYRTVMSFLNLEF